MTRKDRKRIGRYMMYSAILTGLISRADIDPLEIRTHTRTLASGKKIDVETFTIKQLASDILDDCSGTMDEWEEIWGEIDEDDAGDMPETASR